MPVYEYACQHCNQREEKTFPLSSHPKRVRCSKCGKWASKVFVPAPIIFKGSGFYVTDSRTKQTKKTQTEQKKEQKKTESKEKKTTNDNAAKQAS